MSVLSDEFTLSNGVKIPALGLGTWQVPDGDVCVRAGSVALKCGYRHIDTAYAYGNEAGVGAAVYGSGLKREDIFVTTKLPAEIKDAREAEKYLDLSLSALKFGYIDLWLIHAPRPWAEMRSDAPYRYEKENAAIWKVMEAALASGRCRAVGVSNFDAADLENIFAHCSVKPHVNQIRFCIGDAKLGLVEFCRKNGIVTEGYSPLATGRLISDPRLNKIALSYGKTVAQLCLRYLIERGVLPLPKSVHPEYIKDNAELDFVIGKDDLSYLDSLKDFNK